MLIKKMFFALLVGLSAGLCSLTPLPTATRDNNLALGNPSNADATNPDNFLYDKNLFIMSYNAKKSTPNWVSWHLSKAWTGKFKRKDHFHTDKNLPSGDYKVKKSDYDNTGFNRGHMCPSADRNKNATENDVTFLMSNMVPQSPICNQQTWGDLEDYLRELVGEDKEVYIIAGPWGQGGLGDKGSEKSIAGKITVPKYVWKIALVLPVGDNDLNRIDQNTRVIAVKMPNRESVNNKDWYEYRVSVDEIEAMTGYDFLGNVSAGVQNQIEGRVDDVEIE